MKTKFLLLAFLFLIYVSTISAQAPNWVWAKSAGGISNDYSNATCTDANGNVYITGTFQGSSITFGGYTLHNTATGALDIFVVKYDASGNVLWARSGGGTYDDYAYGICADIRENVYITGYFRSPAITFGTITLKNDTTNYSSDIFLAKFNSGGNILWVKGFTGGKSDDYSYSVCTDADSNVYITGKFYGNPIIFGNDSLKSRGGYDIFVTKYDAGGNVIWAKGMGGTSTDYGYSICTDEVGNVYVTGFFESKAIFGSDTLVSGFYTVFVTKLDTYGNFLWAKSGGGNESLGTGISTDPNGNVYISGFFQYAVSFGTDTLGNSGNYGIFAAKYDSSGNAIWGRSPGGIGNDYGTSICTDASGHVFVTGYFASSYLNFGGNPVINANVGYDDIFVAAYNGGGNALWAKSVGGQDNDYGMGISSAGGSVYVTGYFGSYNCTFGNTTVTNNGSYDVFLAKLSTITGIEENAMNDGVVIYPNPLTSSSILQLRPLNNQINQWSEVVIYDMVGKEMMRKKLTGDRMEIVKGNLESGVYFVRVRSEDRQWVEKMVVE